MVNADRVKRKLPSLLVDGDTSKRKQWNKFMRNRYRLLQLQKRNPERYNTLTIQLLNLLREIDVELKKEVSKA